MGLGSWIVALPLYISALCSGIFGYTNKDTLPSNISVVVFSILSLFIGAYYLWRRYNRYQAVMSIVLLICAFSLFIISVCQIAMGQPVSSGFYLCSILFAVLGLFFGVPGANPLSLGKSPPVPPLPSDSAALTDVPDAPAAVDLDILGSPRARSASAASSSISSSCSRPKS